jgi:hypothetical protein
MDPEDPVVAQKIVAEYAAVLEEHSQKELYPSPVSDLPYPKQVISTAIRTCLYSLIETEQLTGEIRDFLEVAYISLADFVEADLVRVMSEYQQASAALAEGSQVVKDKMGSPAWKVVSETSRLAGDIAKTLSEETERLRGEFRAAVSDAEAARTGLLGH